MEDDGKVGDILRGHGLGKIRSPVLLSRRGTIWYQFNHHFLVVETEDRREVGFIHVLARTGSLGSPPEPVRAVTGDDGRVTD